MFVISLKSRTNRLNRLLLTTFISLMILILLAPGALCALYRADRTWRTYHYDKITVHFPVGFESQAYHTASLATVHLDSLQVWYGQRPEYIHIILNPDLDENSAFATILPLRIELPVHPALEKGIRPQKGQYLDRVLIHELTHAVQFSTVSGITAWLRPVFGEVIAPCGNQPDWITEGLAIHSESASGGGRLNSSYHWMLWRTQLLVGKPWILSQLAHPGRVSPHRSRAYVGGSMMVRKIVEDYGGERMLPVWLKRQAAWPIMPNMAFKRSFGGRSLSNAHLQLTAHDLWDHTLITRNRSSRGFSLGRPLAGADRTSWRYPGWSPYGEIVARKISYDTPQRVSRINPETRSVGNEVFIPPQSGPALGRSAHHKITPFHDGVISSEIRSGDWGPRERRSILVHVRADGKTVPIGDPPLRGWAPAWSPQSGRLAFIGPAADGILTVKIVELDGNVMPSDQPRIIAQTRYGNYSDPAWSSNGRILAFSADLGDGEHVVLWESKSGTFFEVRVDLADCTWDPAFSPDGSLWVSADPERIFDLFEINIPAETARRRTRVLSGAIEPSVSPDGKSVAYSHYHRQGFIIALLDSSNWTSEPVGITLTRVNPSHYNESPENTLLRQTDKPYNPLKYIAPHFWAPLVGGVLEKGIGAGTYGRDPLGLLEWKAKGLIGLESGTPEINLSAAWRAMPMDLSGFLSTYTEEMTRDFAIYDSSGEFSGWRNDVRHPRRWEGGLALSQQIRREHGPWTSFHFPSAGWVRRDRFIQTRADRGLMVRHYNGLHAGYGYYRSVAAPRDPVPRRLLYFSMLAEKDMMELSQLDGKVFQASIRYHLPVFHDGVVLGLTGALQSQSGEVEYSRSPVRPRGYDRDSDLPAADRLGKLALGGIALHFPLVFPDRGIWQGLLFLERFTGTLFAECATGWGGNRSLDAWIEKDGAGSVGAELGTVGLAFYDAMLRVTTGAAWRTYSEDLSVYIRITLPEIPGLYQLRGHRFGDGIPR